MADSLLANIQELKTQLEIMERLAAQRTSLEAECASIEAKEAELLAGLKGSEAGFDTKLETLKAERELEHAGVDSRYDEIERCLKERHRSMKENVEQKREQIRALREMNLGLQEKLGEESKVSCLVLRFVEMLTGILEIRLHHCRLSGHPGGASDYCEGSTF